MRERKTYSTVEALARATALMMRPDAPNDLTDEQAEEWRAVVNRLPADWLNPRALRSCDLSPSAPSFISRVLGFQYRLAFAA